MGNRHAALVSGNLERHDLALKKSLFGRVLRAPVRLRSEHVLSFAAKAVSGGAQFGAAAHVLVAVSVPETVVNEVVDDFGVSEPQAATRARKQVGRVTHRLHPARYDDLGVT